MTEHDWHSSTDPAPMLAFLRDRGSVSERKLRLFACGACRRMGELIGKAGRKAVAVAERYADGRAADCDLEIARDVLVGGLRPVRSHDDFHARRFQLLPEVCLAYNLNGPAGVARVAERSREFGGADLLRCIFGPLPFRSITCDPSWRTSTAVALAGQFYESRDFTAMPILGDALEDAGCGDEDVLNHCRGPGVHVRGCWVVDQLLGKK